MNFAQGARYFTIGVTLMNDKQISVKQAAKIALVAFGAMGAAIATEALSDMNALIAGIGVFYAMLYMNDRKGGEALDEE